MTREEAGALCEKLGNVQQLTDDGVEEVRRNGNYRSDAEFGTRVHKYIADDIRGQGNPNYKAEVSLLKSLEAGGQPRPPAGFDPGKFYGQLGTTRIDAYEYHPESRTVCIYDPKTENARLSIPRMAEMASRAKENFRDVDRIVVMEVKPSRR